MTDSDKAHRPLLAQQHGILVLNKPAGPTSNRCLTAVKRLGQKKIGHAGTLDPMADGVLLVLLGTATRISGHLLEGGSKVYCATVELGRETDTWDNEGRTIATASPASVKDEDVRRIIASFEGDLEQIVPPYSAAKSGGQPLYRLARAGRDVPVKLKTVQIFRAEILALEFPLVRFRVTCSSGTYIRSLAHSLGKRLGCGATLVALTREYSHPFGLDEATDLDELVEHPDLLATRLRSIEEALPDWPVVEVGEELARKVKNGMPVPCPARFLDNARVLLRHSGTALALGAVDGGRINVVRGLWS